MSLDYSSVSKMYKDKMFNCTAKLKKVIKIL